MNTYISGELIKDLRKSKGLTQLELAELLMVSEKTISKWETKRGLPDISLIEPLSKVLGVSVLELFNGKVISNKNKCANMLKAVFYVCPICGNVNISIGESTHSCCGNELICEEYEIDNELNIQNIDNEIFIKKDAPMTKDNYISFFAYVTPSKIYFNKLYPEQECETSFTREGKGIIYYYNNRNGLFRKDI